MVFIRDEGSRFAAPLDRVWKLVSSGPIHSAAHGHRATVRRSLPGNAGEYSWEQDFDGASTRFMMRWTAFPPVGVAYDVLEGPFSGSRFFLYYIPRGDETEVVVVGEFVSSILPPEQIRPAVERFFSVEFDQDSAALRTFPDAP